jgi:anti-sigma-K factor RskA
MMPLELTRAGSAATTLSMQKTTQRSGWRAVSAVTMLAAGSLAMSGCISVNAPDKPIVIELNINIKQDVVYSLAPDAKSTIESNSGIF